jgi:RNA polymerase sigma factor (sigma-70 family)
MSIMRADRDERIAVNDRRLARLVREEGVDADREIARILTDDARPLVRRVVSRYTKSGRLLTAEDAEDVAATVDVRLVEKLRAVASDRGDSISDLHSYVATVAHNTVNDFLRKRFPEHARLKKRVRYLLAHDGRFAVWLTAAGPAGGLAEWKGREDVLDALPPSMTGANADAVEEVFRSGGKPVLVDMLVTLFDDGSASESVPIDDAADQMVPTDERLEDREAVRVLWLEIRQLPAMQRRALLLNLRYDGELDSLSVLLLSGIAGIGELAVALEMSERELAAIWNDLPYDDQRVAALLGVTRQQVINLRKAARARLARRLRR